jgi:hypothetical protein
MNRENARKLRAFCQRPENIGSHRTAWWGWKDSNRQPSHYGPPSMSLPIATIQRASSTELPAESGEKRRRAVPVKVRPFYASKQQKNAHFH